MRVECLRKPKRCPHCGYSPMASILFGLPLIDEKLDKQLQAGQVSLGGCCITNDDPDGSVLNVESRFIRKVRTSP